MKISYKLPVHPTEGRISKSGNAIYLPVKVHPPLSTADILNMTLAIYPSALRGEGLVVLPGAPKGQGDEVTPLPEGTLITIEV